MTRQGFIQQPGFQPGRCAFQGHVSADSARTRLAMSVPEDLPRRGHGSWHMFARDAKPRVVGLFMRPHLSVTRR